METGFIIAIVILCVVVAALAVCLVVGKGKLNVTKNSDVKGTLNVIIDDPDEDPGMFVAWSCPIDEIVNQKYVTVDVKVIRPNSHK